MLEAKSMSVSLWKHIQCHDCLKWWAIEDDESIKYFCPHCGTINLTPKVNNESKNHINEEANR